MSEEISRRALLGRIGLSVSLAGMGRNVLSAEDAAHVHHMVQAEAAGAPYRPKCFNPHEYATLRRLVDLIVPADEHSPGALAAGAAEFIDLLAGANQELAAIYTGGLAWLDEASRRRSGAAFADAPPAEQAALLDLIAYRRNDSPELGPGIRFFAWARNMAVDAFFTSQAGMDYLGFLGNGAVSQFSVPREAIEYALKRSPV